jgi:hypothetical protein
MNVSKISDIALSFDLAKATKSFETNPARNSIQMGAIKADGVPLVAILEGTCGIDKIHCSSLFNKHNFSVPMELSNRQEINALFGKLTKLVQQTVPEWSIHDPMTREDFWLRINYNEKTKKFKTTSNLNFTTVKSVEKISNLMGKEVKATVEIKAWFNFKDEKAGVSINVLEVDFE